MNKSFEEFIEENNIDLTNTFIDENINKLRKVYYEKNKLINILSRLRIINQYKGVYNHKYDKEIKEYKEMIELCDNLIKDSLEKIRMDNDIKFK